MQLRSITLRQDGHYVASLDGDHGDDVSLVATSLGELHSRIHECVTDQDGRFEADDVFDDFLEELIQDAVVNLNRLNARFGGIAA